MNIPQHPRNPLTSTFAGLGIRADLHGQYYISWLRCSADPQSDTSPQGQKEVNDAYASLQGMRWAGHDVIVSTSGSQTFNREDIKEIIELKRAKNDFTKVIVFEWGRVTRGGVRHGNVVEDALRKEGLELISSTELIPDGPLGELVKAVKHYGNQQQATNISKSVARGLAQSLAKSTRPAAGRTPFGLDRLYIDPDQKPRTLIRWDGPFQLRLDPSTKVEIGRTKRAPSRQARKKGQKKAERVRFVGYKKQDDETSLLVSGAEQRLILLREIFRMRFLKRMGAHRIIKYIHSTGVKSPWDSEWNLTTVKNILDNPIYIGVEVRHRWTKCLYHMLGRDGPIPVIVDQDKLEKEGRMGVPQTERPRDDWMLVDKPELKDILPPDVRQLAIDHFVKLYDRDAGIAKQARRKSRGNKADDNPYVLSQILRSKQTSHLMRGDSNRKKRKSGISVIRYYFDYSTASKAVSGLHARRVRAEPLENAVLPVIMEVFKDTDWVAQQVRTSVLAAADNTCGEHDRQQLVSEREDITRRLARIDKSSGHLTDDELEPLVAADNARIVEIRHTLSRMQAMPPADQPTPEEAISTIVKRLASLPDSWRTLPNRELKHLLSVVIEHLTIDLETLEIDLRLRLPRESLRPIGVATSETGRVTDTSLWSSLTGATRVGDIAIEHVVCHHSDRCYTCSRRRRAA